MRSLISTIRGVGERDHLGNPLPEFIGALPLDLADLMVSRIFVSWNQLDRLLRQVKALERVACARAGVPPTIGDNTVGPLGENILVF